MFSNRPILTSKGANLCSCSALREGRMDTYTKAVLTVIVMSLTAIALQNSAALPAHAAPLQGGVCGLDLSGKNYDCARVVNSALLVRLQRLV